MVSGCQMESAIEPATVKSVNLLYVVSSIVVP